MESEPHKVTVVLMTPESMAKTLADFSALLMAAAQTAGQLHDMMQEFRTGKVMFSTPDAPGRMSAVFDGKFDEIQAIAGRMASAIPERIAFTMKDNDAKWDEANHPGSVVPQ